jgi:hypothetical protein
LEAPLLSKVFIRMKVFSEFYLSVDALELRTAGFSRKVLTLQPMDFSHGDPILLRVNLLDADGLRVSRSSELAQLDAVSYSGFEEYSPVRLRPSQYQDDVHEALLPSDWFPSPGTHNIRIRCNVSSDGPQAVTFQIVFRSAHFHYFVYAGIVGAMLLLLLVILGVLVWRTPERAKVILKSYLKFELRLWAESSIEAFDTLTDTLSCLSIVMDDEAEWLRFGYLAGYGIALVSSVLTFVLMWKLVLQKILMRFRR